ncbi:MAG: RsiV family protein [Trueperaceae bacterium]|nr:RsiV family protein [Trueperaceae bacterium]
MFWRTHPLHVRAVVAAGLLLAVSGLTFAGGAWYLARPEVPGGAMLALHVDPATQEARGAWRDAPHRPGDTAGLDLVLIGRAEEDGEHLAVRLDAFAAEGVTAADPRDASGDPVGTVVVRADRRHGATDLDPFGAAEASFRPAGECAPRTLSLSAVATRYDFAARLTDGSFEVTREVPFFYAEPWGTLSLRARASPDPGPSVTDGLTERAGRPMGVAAQWFDEAVTEITALTRTLVSTRTTVHAYAGGAHPNTWFTFATFVRDGEAWRDVGLCEALAHLDRACPETALRRSVHQALLAQKAAWVVQGEVTADTPWLLEPFTLTPSGVRFDYAPYEVGPYVDGPFSVTVPYSAPR